MSYPLLSGVSIERGQSRKFPARPFFSQRYNLYPVSVTHIWNCPNRCSTDKPCAINSKYSGHNETNEKIISISPFKKKPDRKFIPLLKNETSHLLFFVALFKLSRPGKLFKVKSFKINSLHRNILHSTGQGATKV